MAVYSGFNKSSNRAFKVTHLGGIVSLSLGWKKSPKSGLYKFSRGHIYCFFQAFQGARLFQTLEYMLCKLESTSLLGDVYKVRQRF